MEHERYEARIKRFLSKLGMAQEAAESGSATSLTDGNDEVKKIVST